MLTWTVDAGLLNDLNYARNFVQGSCGSRSFVLGPYRREQCDDMLVVTSYCSVNLTTPEFVTLINGQPVYDRIQGAKHRLDARFKTRTSAFVRAPHGLIGQDYVGVSHNGRVDVYPPLGNFTTTAWAEGGIDGVPSDYEMPSRISTNFTFSRFGGPRGVSDSVSVDFDYGIVGVD